MKLLCYFSMFLIISVSIFALDYEQIKNRELKQGEIYFNCYEDSSGQMNILFRFVQNYDNYVYGIKVYSEKSDSLLVAVIDNKLENTSVYNNVMDEKPQSVIKTEISNEINPKIVLENSFYNEDKIKIDYIVKSESGFTSLTIGNVKLITDSDKYSFILGFSSENGEKRTYIISCLCNDEDCGTIYCPTSEYTLCCTKWIQNCFCLCGWVECPR